MEDHKSNFLSGNMCDLKQNFNTSNMPGVARLQRKLPGKTMIRCTSIFLMLLLGGKQIFNNGGVSTTLVLLLIKARVGTTLIRSHRRQVASLAQEGKEGFNSLRQCGLDQVKPGPS
jgi:hypothetical protein